MAIVASLPLLASAQDPATASRRIGLEDLLHAESLESAWFSPDGRSVAYVRSGSAVSTANQGIFDPRLYSGRVMVADVATGQTREIRDGDAKRYHPVMPFNPDAGGPWSPGSRGLLLTEAQNGSFGLAYWSAASDRIVALPGRPEFSFPVFAWAGDQLIYATVAEGVPQRNATAALAKNLTDRWHAAWEGPGAAPTVSSENPLFAETVPPPGHLMLATPATGASVKVADGDYGAVYVSADKHTFAAIRFAEPRPDALFPIGRRGELEIFVFTSNGARRIAQYPDLDVDAQSVAWSPDGTRLLAGGKASGDAGPVLYLIDGKSGRRERIAPAGLSFADPQVGKAAGLFQVGWIGSLPAAVAARPSSDATPKQGSSSLDYGEHAGMRRDVYVFHGAKAENLSARSRGGAVEFLAPAGLNFAYVVADAALFRLTPGRAPQQLSPTDSPAILGFQREPRYPPPPIADSRHEERGSERLAVMSSAADGQVVTAVLEVGTHTLKPLAGEGELVAFSPDFSLTVRRTDEHWTSRFTLAGVDHTTLAEVNADLSNRLWAQAQRFSFGANDSPTLTGWVLLPPGASRDRPLPAVVVVYGGQVFGATPPSETQAETYLPLFSGQLLAAQGYAVVYPSLPLPHGPDIDPKARLAEETIAAVDALASQHIVDPARVVVMGQSFGGYSTAAILAARSDRFRAGIALAGIFDWAFGYGGQTPERWMADDGRAAFGASAKSQSGLDEAFWRTPEAFERASPIYSVERMNAPLLMLQGDLDDAYFDAARMYGALARAGKKPVLVRYWGEGHLALSEASLRDQWARMTTWLDAYLKTRPQVPPARSDQTR